MQRFRLTLEYMGGAFCGWQIQPAFTAGGVARLPSVQQVLENAVEKLCGKKTKVVGCSRTDAGVHAVGYAAHVDIQRPTRVDKPVAERLDVVGDVQTVIQPRYSPIDVRGAINAFIRPYPLQVLTAEEVDSSFHVRRNNSKTYTYTVIANWPLSSPGPLFWADRAWVIKDALDVEKMKVAGALFEGEHDFGAFRASGCTAPTSLLTLDSVKVSSLSPSNLLNGYFPPIIVEPGVQLVQIRFTGKKFLYNQVRIMASAIVECGRASMQPSRVTTLLAAKDRTLGPRTAPARGLCLEAVCFGPTIN